MSTVTAVTHRQSMRSFSVWMSRHWVETFLAVYGVWLILPFLAPVKLGYMDIWNLEGGMDAWEQAGYPLEGK